MDYTKEEMKMENENKKKILDSKIGLMQPV